MSEFLWEGCWAEGKRLIEERGECENPGERLVQPHFQRKETEDPKGEVTGKVTE